MPFQYLLLISRFQFATKKKERENEREREREGNELGRFCRCHLSHDTFDDYFFIVNQQTLLPIVCMRVDSMLLCVNFSFFYLKD